MLTHGFTLTEQGEKMSKSLGNAVEPDVVIRESGAEILRLWAAMVDYAEDQRIGKTILQTTVDAYRKLRNTVRYLLGALNGFEESERVGYDAMPPLERYILHRLYVLNGWARSCYSAYEFAELWRAVADFCSQEISSFYFDVRKDALYCDPLLSPRRRACRTVLAHIFDYLTAWLSPILPFTMEEAWLARFPDSTSNCLRALPQAPTEWENLAELQRWLGIRELTSVVTGALEIERREKRIGGALEAAPVVLMIDQRQIDAFAWGEGRPEENAAEVFRTSSAQLINPDTEEGWHEANPISSLNDRYFHLEGVSNVWVDPARASGHKCARCWRILPEVTGEGGLCLRCEGAVQALDQHG